MNKLSRKKSDNFFLEFLEDIFNTGVDSSSEFIYSLRFFTVSFDSGGNAKKISTNHIALIDEDKATEYAKNALNSGKEYGDFDGFSYKVKNSGNETLVVCIDTGSQMADSRRVGNIALVLTFVGSILAYFFVRLISLHMIKPEIRAVEKQKQFITNASHELKTPLAVIRANTELEMMMHGEDEWNESTMNQVDRMTGLISNLVQIAKADEKANKEGRTDTDVSGAVEKTTDAFAPVAKQNGKTLTKDVAEGVRMVASESQIQQLVTLFVDNAIKYCDEGGEIKVSLRQKGKGVKIAVSNNYADGKDVDYNRFLDRFYREDQSHNIDKGGFGIGLSIADSIVSQYRGKLEVSYQNGVIEFSAVLKP